MKEMVKSLNQLIRAMEDRKRTGTDSFVWILDDDVALLKDVVKELSGREGEE